MMTVAFLAHGTRVGEVFPHPYLLCNLTRVTHSSQPQFPKKKIIPEPGQLLAYLLGRTYLLNKFFDIHS